MIRLATLWILGLCLVVAVAGNVSAADRHDGYQGAEQIIRQKCEGEWPGDFNMMKYCIDQQRLALQKLRQRASGRTPGNIMDKCANEWPLDFNMREYCIGQQVEALRALESQVPAGIPENILRQIRQKCSGEWPGDYNMQKYCEDQQVGAYRDLYKYDPAPI